MDLMVPQIKEVRFQLAHIFLIHPTLEHLQKHSS